MFNTIFLPVIILIGIFTSWEDIRDFKIRNRWVLAGLIYSFAVYVCASLYFFGGKAYAAGAGAILWNFDKMAINLIISIIVAYCLWHFKMWGAGDAKLFICYSALIPLGRYHFVYFGYYFAAFFLLLVTFVIATVFILLRSIVFLAPKSAGDNKERFSLAAAKALFSSLDPARIFRVTFGFFALFFIFNILSAKIQILAGNKGQFGRGLFLVAAYFLFRGISDFFVKTRLLSVLFVIVFLYSVIFMPREYLPETGRALLWSLVVAITFFVSRLVIDKYFSDFPQEGSTVSAFAPWMFAGVIIVWFI